MGVTSDELTADAISRALTTSAAGHLDEACSIGERALAAGGDAVALNAMIGMFRSRSGDIERAVSHLRVAHHARPNDARIANNFAAALARQDRYEEALEVANDALARSDSSLQLLKLRGFLAQMLERFDIAIDAYESVLTVEQRDWETWNNLGNAQRLAGNVGAGLDALRRAAEINPAAAPVQLNLATALASAGEIDAAELCLRDMTHRFPRDAKPLRELHALFKQQGRDEDALEAIEAAVARDPDDLELRLGLASFQLSMLRHSQAEATYRQVLDRDPSNSLGNLGLAVVFELTNRAEELAQLVKDAEARRIGGGSLNFIRAFDHRRRTRFADGLAALASVPDDLESARRAHLLGQLEEGAGNFDAAFMAFERMNEIQRADASLPEARAAAYRAKVRSQMNRLTPEWMSRWRNSRSEGRPSPAFLVGFPRSGTTLLDTFLMGHPCVEVLEEEPMLRHAEEVMGDFEAWPMASDDQIRAARDAYFKQALIRTPLRPGTLVVDKNPLATNALPLIHRLFPDARIILALRHPCDAVLSCFTTNFKLNDAMSNFLRLDNAAELYDLTFSYLERASGLLPVRVHTTRYENIVSDRDHELRYLLKFLDLRWDGRVLDHEATARSRGHIKTASYAQVIEPIYKGSVGRWLKFREHLQDVLPVLRPWAEKFGYEMPTT